jgi:alpha-galactosidase
MIHRPHERVRMGLFDTPHLGPGPSAEARIAGLRVLAEATGCTDLGVEAVSTGEGGAELRVTALGRIDGAQRRIRVGWSLPCRDAEAYWTPQSAQPPWIPPDWLPPRTTSLTRDAPVGCLLGPDDRNLLCYALAETARPVQIWAGISEETGEFRFRVEYDLVGDEPLRLLLDTAPDHFAAALARVARWWWLYQVE